MYSLFLHDLFNRCSLVPCVHFVFTIARVILHVLGFDSRAGVGPLKLRFCLVAPCLRWSIAFSWVLCVAQQILPEARRSVRCGTLPIGRGAVKVRPGPANSGPSRARFGPRRPILSSFWSSSVNFGPILVRSRTQFDRDRPSFDRTRAALAEFRQFRLNLVRVWSIWQRLRSRSARFCRGRPNSPKRRQIWPNSAANLARFC